MAKEDWYQKHDEITVRRIHAEEGVERDRQELVISGVKRLFDVGEVNPSIGPTPYNFYENGLPQNFLDAFAKWFGHGSSPQYDVTYSNHEPVQVFNFRISSDENHSTVDISFKRDKVYTPRRIDFETCSYQWENRVINYHEEKRESGAFDWGETTTLEVVTALNMLMDKSLARPTERGASVAASA